MVPRPAHRHRAWPEAQDAEACGEPGARAVPSFVALHAGRPLKSPLAVASSRIPSPLPASAPGAASSARAAGLSKRETTIAEYEDYLRTTTNRDDRPYEEGTINAYVSPARHLDGWMKGKESTATSPSWTLPR